METNFTTENPTYRYFPIVRSRDVRHEQILVLQWVLNAFDFYGAPHIKCREEIHEKIGKLKDIQGE